MITTNEDLKTAIRELCELHAELALTRKEIESFNGKEIRVLSGRLTDITETEIVLFHAEIDAYIDAIGEPVRVAENLPPPIKVGLASG